ncbi:MAG: IS630 transposase-related protein [Pseudomonadota bacterium]
MQKAQCLHDSETARRFCISLSSLRYWHIKAEPIRRRTRPSRIDMEALARDVDAYPDDYQYERAQRFGMSQRGIYGALRRLGATVKKSLVHPKAEEKAKESFAKKIDRYKGKRRPVYDLDESGFAVDMPRRHGYSIKGQGVLANTIGMPKAGLMSSALYWEKN